MDRISQLHDELLLGILSLLPTAKDVVATMVLSKRWQFLWMMVPTLVYDDSYQNIDYGRFSTFVDRSLVLHKAPVIEILHFKLGKTCDSSTGDTLNRAADKCCVRSLIIEIDTSSTSNTSVALPRSLYSGGCTRFVTLKLSNAVLLDVSSPIYFPSLKNLSLIYMKYPGGDEFVKRLLSSCPVLEDLVVERHRDDSVAIFTVKVPYLKKLVLQNKRKVINKSSGFVIDAPSLECLDFAEYSCGFCIVENNLCKVSTASIDVFAPQTKQLLGSLTSAKRLFLCLSNSKDAYPDGSIFRSLVHLTICICETEWLNILIRVLRDSPNLKTLEIQENHHIRAGEPRPCWKDTSLVPEYLLPSLETFEWIYYEGTETDKEVVAFILRIASSLRQANIKSSRSINHDKKLEMLKDFPVSSRRSPACLLAFWWSLEP